MLYVLKPTFAPNLLEMFVFLCLVGDGLQDVPFSWLSRTPGTTIYFLSIILKVIHFIGITIINGY